MTAPDLDAWLEMSASFSSENPLNVPYSVALAEAAEVARFVDEHWEGEGDLPGLSRYEARLPRATADEIRALIVAVQWQQTRVFLQTAPTRVGLGAEAIALVDELASTLEFVLDGEAEGPAALQLARLKQRHARGGRGASALAQALRDHSALAEALRDRILEADKGFDVALIARARELADRLALAPSAAARPADQERERAARNRLLGLLMQKVSLVRATAAHAFRKHPDLVRQVTSAYERRRRTAARKAAAAKGAPGRPPALEGARRSRPSALEDARPSRPSALEDARPSRPSALEGGRPDLRRS
ncbi:MAG TPA: hypothetical protein VFS43_35585 [Polyangiaceae bacterium]|nr:hypothetical protein [Polyangiaceae bacterium]